jgi:hypothetical protein
MADLLYHAMVLLNVQVSCMFVNCSWLLSISVRRPLSRHLPLASIDCCTDRVSV